MSELLFCLIWLVVMLMSVPLAKVVDLIILLVLAFIVVKLISNAFGSTPIPRKQP